MVQRCTNPHPTSDSYERYKGVKVCERWLVFENFLADMGEPPLDYSIDRIKNDLGYEPDNCRWIPKRQQQWNTRRNTYVTYQGQTKSVAQWCEELGLNYHRVRQRIVKLGWAPERAFTEPCGHVSGPKGT